MAYVCCALGRRTQSKRPMSADAYDIPRMQSISRPKLSTMSTWSWISRLVLIEFLEYGIFETVIIMCVNERCNLRMYNR